jgi:fermentation-respiration switch protein FrsA (DUF1100 family)
MQQRKTAGNAVPVGSGPSVTDSGDATAASSSSASSSPSRPPTASVNRTTDADDPFRNRKSVVLVALLRLLKPVGIAYLGVVVMMVMAQEKLVFPGASFASNIPKQLPKHLSITTLHRQQSSATSPPAATAATATDLPFRVAESEPRYTADLDRPHGAADNDGGDVDGAAADGIGEGRQSRCVMLFFGGNGENMMAALYRADELSRYNCRVIAIEPPGFGPPEVSTGPPSVQSLMAAADSAGRHALSVVNQMQKKIPPASTTAATSVKLIIVGSSLGTFSAVHLFARGVGDKLLLHAPLTSMLEVAATLYWFLPVQYAMSSSLQFDNYANLATIRDYSDSINSSSSQCYSARILILHGDEDEIVPFAVGRRVFKLLHYSTETAAASGSSAAKRFPRFSTEVDDASSSCFVSCHGKHHNDVDLSATGPQAGLIHRFLQFL